MKKLIFAAVISATAFLTSCNVNKKSVYQVWLLSSIEREDVGSGKITTTQFVYSDMKGNTTENGASFIALPRLVEQRISGDTISRIAYSYTDKTITARKYLTRPGADVIVDSLGFNLSGMAATELFADGTSKPYYIKYSENIRTDVGQIALETKYRNYVKAMDAQKNIIAEYSYYQNPNYIGLQQETIYGDPYYWPTDKFGAQSNNLLDKSVVYENGKQLNYEFSYQFDLRGFVSLEEIKRNRVLIVINKYTYKMGLVEM